MATCVRSFAKINLGLGVGPARADGFHGLTTVYQTLALHEFVTVTASLAAETYVWVTADHAGVPRTEAGNAERNTAWKMVAGALKRMGVSAEVTIHIEKKLPVQGGMGAGSANAVAALLGLERELGRSLPKAERMELAAEVGSDVPLFLLGGTVLGLGRGERVFALEDIPATWCVVAVPGVGVSTGAAFRELDQRQGQVTRHKGQGDGAGLTFQQGAGTLEKLSCAYAAIWDVDRVSGHKPDGAENNPSGITRAEGAEELILAQRGDLAENPLLALVRTGIENDFEEVVFSQHPSLRSTKRDLVGTSGTTAIFAGLSGSGSALFGLYRSEREARAAQHRVQANGTRAILTETLPRAGYWHTMFAE